MKEEQEKENATIERKRLTEESVEDFSGTTSSEVESRSDRKTVKGKNVQLSFLSILFTHGAYPAVSNTRRSSYLMISLLFENCLSYFLQTKT